MNKWAQSGLIFYSIIHDIDRHRRSYRIIVLFYMRLYEFLRFYDWLIDTKYYELEILPRRRKRNTAYDHKWSFIDFHIRARLLPVDWLLRTKFYNTKTNGQASGYFDFISFQCTVHVCLLTISSHHSFHIRKKYRIFNLFNLISFVEKKRGWLKVYVCL